VRKNLLQKLLGANRHQLKPADLDRLADQTDGYSCSDLHALAKEAALGPLRDLTATELQSIAADKIRPIRPADFQQAMSRVRPSVDKRQLAAYDDWGKLFGGNA
jgi:spastin